jgi:3-deoxy-7-phosphoheptulonate synthase
MQNTDDLRIVATREVVSPAQVHLDMPITEAATQTILNTRAAIQRILTAQEDRLLVIVGPCSIHDTRAAYDYAQRLKELSNELSNDLLLVMRVYFEKPRTTVGWKGLINDPDLNDSFDINKGLHLARQLLLDINTLGVPAATEYLDLITPQYVADLIAWGAIGARTTESQVHRELASGLSCPVGFKNATDGTIKIAIDAIRAAMQAHHFLSVTKEGRSAIFSTTGNSDVHIILRGGHHGANYDARHVNQVCHALTTAGLPPQVMIDCSHANCSKDYLKQITVSQNISEQLIAGDRRIIGVMLESHLHGGRQDVIQGQEQQLIYGQSITDACLGWENSVTVLRELATAVQKRRYFHR